MVMKLFCFVDKGVFEGLKMKAGGIDIKVIGVGVEL